MLSARLQILLAGAATFAILVESPSVALGLVTLRPNVWYDGSVALLDELYVVPAVRNGGIGSAVMAVLVGECRARGVDLIEINVDEADVDAQRFYERHGYSDVEVATGERSVYYFNELAKDAQT